MIPEYKLFDLLEFINSLPDDHEVNYANPTTDPYCPPCIMSQFFQHKSVENFRRVNVIGDMAIDKTNAAVAHIKLPEPVRAIHLLANNIGELKKAIKNNPEWNIL